MIQLLIVLLVALVFEAVGVVFLSGGLKQIGAGQQIAFGEIGRLITRGATNRNILLGVFFEATFFGALLYLLARRDVSLIWPLTSLGFVITAIAAKFLLHEQISWMRWFGVTLIVIGAGLVTWSEKMKERPPQPAAAAPSASTQSQ
jgi:drug/metabolite transporter (DMT)-like permease